MAQRLNLSARFDDVCYNDEVCLIQDSKAGFTEPEPVKTNAQMLVNVLLVAMNLARIGVQPKRFVVQLVTVPFGVLEETFEYADLSEIWQDVTNTLRELEKEDAQLHPSTKTCKHCPAILVCDAIKSMSVKLNPIDTAPEALARNLNKIALMREHMDEFEAFCVRGLTDAKFTIPSWSMMPGAERIDWKDLKAAQDIMSELGISITGLRTHTVSAYLKLYAKKYDKKPDEVREAFYQVMDGCLERKSNKPSLKKIS